MKKIILIAVFILFAGLTSLVAQKPHGTQPIPSYDFKLTETTEFVEGSKSIAPLSKEKREMEIVIASSGGTAPFEVFATVWLYKRKGNVVEGPYTIHLDEPFSKTIDQGVWSVIMRCDFDNIQTSVWID